MIDTSGAIVQDTFRSRQHDAECTKCGEFTVLSPAFTLEGRMALRRRVRRHVRETGHIVRVIQTIRYDYALWEHAAETTDTEAGT